MAITTSLTPARSAARSWSLVGFFSKFVGPAALTAAGMIWAGAVSTRLLAGAWFGFDLLWVALGVVPLVIFTLDSASRVGILSGGRGLLEMVRTELGAWLMPAWCAISSSCRTRPSLRNARRRSVR